MSVYLGLREKEWDKERKRWCLASPSLRGASVGIVPGGDEAIPNKQVDCFVVPPRNDEDQTKI
jgi:hypothetical protein